MKLVTSITALLAGLTLSAQDYNFQITIARNQSVSTAFDLGTMNINFNTYGSHYTDGSDATVFVLDSSFVRPYTRDSASVNIMVNDSRPHLQATLEVPFGIFSNSTDEIYILGAWSNPNTSNLFDVELVENFSGVRYNMYTENSFSLGADVAFNNQFTIVFTPHAYLMTFNESCFGEMDGSLYAQSPASNWQLEMYSGATLLNSYNITGRDTFITNQSAGNYTFIYKINNIAIDTTNATITSPAAVTPSYNMSNNTPEVNESVSFTNTSAGAMQYEWDFGDGNTSSAASPSHTYTVVGFYAVTLTAYNFEGCSNTSTTPVTVVAASSSIQPMSRGNSHAMETARTPEANVRSNEGQAHITSANENAIAQLTVYTVTGQLIYSGTGNNNTFSYETPGIYIAHIVYANGQQESKKVPLN